MMSSGLAWNILKGTVSEFVEDNVPRLAAALAYYAMFSLGPLLVIVIAVAGLFFEKADVNDEVTQQIQGFIGQRAAATVQTMLSSEPHQSSMLATVLGMAALLLGASGVFGQLQDALNTIWEVKPRPGLGILNYLRVRFVSFAMVLGIAFLLLVSLVISTILELLSSRINHLFPMPGVVAKALHFGVSFLVITLLFAMIFKVLPDVTIKWRDVWVGAIGTSLLFSLGKFLIAAYLGQQSTSSTYGAAGSVVVILLWVYYSSIILFFGAEFTQVYAKKSGSRVVPTAQAVPVTEETRAQEGIPHRDGGRLEPASAQAGSRAPFGAESAETPRTRPATSQPRAVVVSALGAGFLSGWFAHRKLTQRASNQKGA